MTFRYLLWLACVFLVVHGKAKSKVKHEWKYIDYQWKNLQQKQRAMHNGNYSINSCVPFDMHEASDRRMFLTVVKNDGVPATLATVTDEIGEGGPLLRPYPNWSWYEDNPGKRCTGIISVYRVDIKCNHLFVLDNGKSGENEICPPQLLIFDLRTDKLVKRVIIPKNVATNENGTGLLVTPIVYVRDGRCGAMLNNAIVYMADTEGYGVVVWNSFTSTLSRIESPSFKADPIAQIFNINGDSFQLSDGILGMSLATDGPNLNDPIMYYRPLASYDLFHTKAKDLALQGVGQPFINYKREPTQLTSQSAAQAFSNEGVLFFSGSTEMSILCWNRHKPFTLENIATVLQSDEELQFAAGVKVCGKRLHVLTNRYQQIAANTINFGEVNFRVVTANVKELLAHTICI